MKFAFGQIACAIPLSTHLSNASLSKTYCKFITHMKSETVKGNYKFAYIFNTPTHSYRHSSAEFIFSKVFPHLK